MPPLERGIAWLTRGQLQLSGLLVPSLVLHTIGARSGIERDTPLMYCPEGDGLMLVTGSNFARDAHPAWTANLLANPAVARLLSPSEIDTLLEPEGYLGRARDEVDAVIAHAEALRRTDPR